MEYTIHLGEDTLNELDKIVNGAGSEGGGGGSSDFETVTVTNKTGNTIYVEAINANGEPETEIANNASAQIAVGKLSIEGATAVFAQLLLCSAPLFTADSIFSPLGNWDVSEEESTGIIDVAFALRTISDPEVRCYLYVYCRENANIVIVPSGTPQ